MGGHCCEPCKFRSQGEDFGKSLLFIAKVRTSTLVTAIWAAACSSFPNPSGSLLEVEIRHDLPLEDGCVCHKRWCHVCTEFLGQHPPHQSLGGRWQRDSCRGVCVLHSHSGQVNQGGLSEQMGLSPGISNLDLVMEGSKSQVAIHMRSSVVAANFSSLGSIPEDVSLTSAGLSMATWHELPVEASLGFSSDLWDNAIVFVPPIAYCTVWTSRLVPPQWVPDARKLSTSSSFIYKTSRAPDIVKTSL